MTARCKSKWRNSWDGASDMVRRLVTRTIAQQIRGPVEKATSPFHCAFWHKVHDGRLWPKPHLANVGVLMFWPNFLLLLFIVSVVVVPGCFGVACVVVPVWCCLCGGACVVVPVWWCLCGGAVMADFGQTDFGQFQCFRVSTDFGQTDFGQFECFRVLTDFGQTDFGQFECFSVLAKFSGVVVLCCCFVLLFCVVVLCCCFVLLLCCCVVVPNP